MGPNEEEQYTVQRTVQQDESPSTGKQALIGIGTVVLLLFLPSVLEVAAGGKPWRR